MCCRARGTQPRFSLAYAWPLVPGPSPLRKAAAVTADATYAASMLNEPPNTAIHVHTQLKFVFSQRLRTGDSVRRTPQ